jgi:ankyrin repeat protein
MARLNICVIGFVGLLSMSVSCAETRLGGMTLPQAFPDERVAKLVEAVTDGNYAEADKQLKAGADINMVGTDGISPLLWVIATRNIKANEYMLKAGANPNYRDEKRHGSAMYLAAGGNSPELLELLLKYKGNPNLIGPRDEPILHIAVEQDRRKNIELLLKYGGDVNIVNGFGSTAAQDAVALGRFDLVAYFLERGLTYNLQGLAKTVEGRPVPPNSDAQRWKDKVIVMLKERGAKFPAFDPKNPSGK